MVMVGTGCGVFVYSSRCSLIFPQWILTPAPYVNVIIKVDEAKENPFQAMLTTKKTQWLMWEIQVYARNTFTF